MLISENSIPDLAICGFVLCSIILIPSFLFLIWIMNGNYKKSIDMERELRSIEVDAVRQYWMERLQERGYADK